MERRRKERTERRRVSNACIRCRQQKIKCSGTHPCPSCSSRGITCVFEVEDKKVVVTEGYVRGLRQKILELESRLAAESSRLEVASSQTSNDESDDGRLHSATPRPEPQYRHEQVTNNRIVGQMASAQATASQAPPAPVVDTGLAPMVNPLASDATAYMQDNSGRLRHLGNTSTWSFNHRVLYLAHTHLKPTSPKESSLHAEGEAFDLGWSGFRNDSPVSVEGLPSLDFAIYLVNTVKFRICQIFHLFDEEIFFTNMYRFYENPTQVAMESRLWYIHFLLIMAFGKAFVGRTQEPNRLPGRELFIRAMTLLPDAIYLCADQLQASEILVCAALYWQSLDFRAAALVYVGQAMRVSMSHGLHTDIQAQDVGEKVMHRCRRIWWTIYILDRKLSCLMGTPNSILDEDITTPLPVHPENITSNTVFSLHIQLAKVVGMIVSTVYSVDGRLNKSFLPTTQRILRHLAGLADELTSFSARPFGGLNRSAGHLTVTYHQAIILATRPILYFLLKARLESANPADASLVPVSEPAMGLLNVCVDSSLRTIQILSTLQQQSLLDSFLPFDLDGISSAGFVLAIASALYPHSVSDPQWRHTVAHLLEEMATNGNTLAKIRLEEINNLAVLSSLEKDSAGAILQADFPQQQQPHTDLNSLAEVAATVEYPSTDGGSLDDFVIHEGFSATQILSLADTLNPDDFPEVWRYDSSQPEIID